MTKTIKETWKEDIYEIITHNETSECHIKLVVLVEVLISQVEALVKKQTVGEERQFILNVLDGVDIADKQMGVTGGTQAIRQALQSRT